MHILISNDDGVSAPGIEALAREMKTIAFAAPELMGIM